MTTIPIIFWSDVVCNARKPRKLVHDIRKYFVKQPDAIEVLIFKGKSEISVSRRFALSTRFYFEFKKMFEK